jgi:general stress protein 26
VLLTTELFMPPEVLRVTLSKEASMHAPTELQQKFWKALKTDRTMMLGLNGVDEGHVRPMTAQFEDDKSPIWFFSSYDSDMVNAIGGDARAIANFSSKGHDVFATVHGSICVDNDPAVIDRLWNPFVAAWYEGGQADPKLALLRLDAERAEIWLDGSSLIAGVKMLLGMDPKVDYKDHAAEVRLD